MVLATLEIKGNPRQGDSP